jgi:regulator of replication initiation timing
MEQSMWRHKLKEYLARIHELKDENDHLKNKLKNLQTIDYDESERKEQRLKLTEQELTRIQSSMETIFTSESNF